MWIRTHIVNLNMFSVPLGRFSNKVVSNIFRVQFGSVFCSIISSSLRCTLNVIGSNIGPMLLVFFNTLCLVENMGPRACFSPESPGNFSGSLSQF